MKKVSFYFLVLCTLLCSSCNKERQQEIDYINHVLSEHPELSDYNWLVIIPGVGCNGCIQEGEYFLKKHVSDKTIGFVLTNISSLKILQQKTGCRAIQSGPSNSLRAGMCLSQQTAALR